MTNEVIQNILTRCSVRAYDDRPVEREKIDTLLQCAVHAPSAMNRQTWHFSAVLNREKIAKLTAAVGKALGNEKYDMYKPAVLIIPSNELIGDTGITSWDNACALKISSSRRIPWGLVLCGSTSFPTRATCLRCAPF